MQVSDGISHPKLRETVSLIAPLIASDDLADELADGVALSLSFSLASRCVAGGVAAISLSRTWAAEPRDGLLLVPVRRVQELIRWPESECMLMTSLIRYGVQELVRWLERVHGVRATQFIGQSKGKGENEKGMAQKEQRRVVKQFREGVFNVLVATSIGEEGLDIGAC
jgi:hypothetical protein